MIKYPSTYLDPTDTLTCGQVFRFIPYNKGYLSFAQDKCAYLCEQSGYVNIDCDDEKFWREYFDLDADYEGIVKSVLSCGNNKVVTACSKHKGIRILRQSRYEALVSFVISQNNNIPRIKGIIERVCAAFGEKKSFGGVDYYAFPKVERLAEGDVKLFESLGLGYRAEYVAGVVKSLQSGELDLDYLSGLSADELKNALLKIKGVGNKVADCALLFGFHKTDAFPVDTWIEKLYHEDFDGKLTDRKKISEYFVSLFGDNAGLVQQYLFHAKRSGDL